jgi:hypothetical protein
MKVKPVKSYKEPGYPDKSLVLRNPAILKTLPKRWLGNAKVGIALSSLLVMTLTACGRMKTGGGEIETNDSADPEGIVAPIFKHGEGTGSFGCVSVAPPVFLSEAEAFQIISDEMKKAGIEMEKDKLSIKNARIPVTYIYPNEREHTKRSTKGTLVFDGYDENKKLAFEFISVEDVVAWQEKNPGVRVTVECYDALDTAERLRENLDGETGDKSVALFYDPMGFDEDLYDSYSRQMDDLYADDTLSDEEIWSKREEIDNDYKEERFSIREAELRQQVKDFLEWAKAQGII